MSTKIPAFHLLKSTHFLLLPFCLQSPIKTISNELISHSRHNRHYKIYHTWLSPHIQQPYSIFYTCWNTYLPMWSHLAPCSFHFRPISPSTTSSPIPCTETPLSQPGIQLTWEVTGCETSLHRYSFPNPPKMHRTYVKIPSFHREYTYSPLAAFIQCFSSLFKDCLPRSWYFSYA